MGHFMLKRRIGTVPASDRCRAIIEATFAPFRVTRPRALPGRAGGSVVAARLVHRTGRLDVSRQPQVFSDRRIVRQRGPAPHSGRPVSRVGRGTQEDSYGAKIEFGYRDNR